MLCRPILCLCPPPHTLSAVRFFPAYTDIRIEILPLPSIKPPGNINFKHFEGGGGELNRGEAYLRGGLLDLVACKQALQLGDGSLRSTYKMDSLLADYKFSKHDGINSP